METEVHLNGVPFGNKEPAAFTSRHPPESGELVDSDSDPDPTPMASLQPGSLDETVVPEEEQGKGLSGLAVSSGRAGGVPSSDTDSSYETGEPTSTASSRYHSLQNISAINFDGMASSPETGGFHTPRSMSGVYYEEDGQHSISVEIPALREGDIHVNIRPLEEDDATPIGKEPKQRYISDQPKLLLHEPPVAPQLEKEPLPSSPTSSAEDDDTIVPGPPRRHAQGRREPGEATPLLPREWPKPDLDESSSCCCTLL